MTATATTEIISSNSRGQHNDWQCDQAPSAILIEKTLPKTHILGYWFAKFWTDFGFSPPNRCVFNSTVKYIYLWAYTKGSNKQSKRWNLPQIFMCSYTLVLVDKWHHLAKSAISKPYHFLLFILLWAHSSYYNSHWCSFIIAYYILLLYLVE